MLIALLLFSYRCIVTINVLWLFLVVPWVGMQYVIVVFPDHTHLLYDHRKNTVTTESPERGLSNNLKYKVSLR